MVAPTPKLARMLAVSAVVIAVVAGPASADERCFGDWSDAAPVVAREQLRSARDVQDTARQELGGDIVRILLCEEPEGFVYRLVLRHSDGRIGKLTVSARR